MEIDTFRKWLAERGCHFDTPHHQRGEGHGHLTIHREGRIAELPLTGSRQPTGYGNRSPAQRVEHFVGDRDLRQRHPRLAVSTMRPAIFKRCRRMLVNSLWRSGCQDGT
jgi:hypothetical protein